MEQLTIKQPKSFTKLVGQSLNVGQELRALVYHLISILEVKNSATISILANQLLEREVDIDGVTLEFYLDLGVVSGFFKRMKSGDTVLYALNTKKKTKAKPKAVKEHVRPNRGIGNSIVNLLNSDKIDKLFHVPQVVSLLSDAYPSLTVRTVEATLWLINRSQPNQLIIDKGTYLVKGKINYLQATKPNS